MAFACDFLGGDVVEIGDHTLRIGERSDYSRDTYSVPLCIDGDDDFTQTGEEVAIGEDIRITAMPKRGRCVRLEIAAPGSVPIRIVENKARPRTSHVTRAARV